MLDNRPLSPHITIHKWILSQIMSICHRATAIGYSFSLLFLSIWMISFSLGPQYFSLFQLVFYNLFGKIIILIISFCFCFHFFDEFRKIFWALGLGLNIKSIKITSYIVILCSVIFSILIFILL